MSPDPGYQKKKKQQQKKVKSNGGCIYVWFVKLSRAGVGARPVTVVISMFVTLS
jgi:hypothetical protein